MTAFCSCWISVSFFFTKFLYSRPRVLSKAKISHFNFYEVITDVGAEVGERTFVRVADEHFLEQFYTLIVVAKVFVRYSLNFAYPKRFSDFAILKQSRIASTLALYPSAVSAILMSLVNLDMPLYWAIYPSRVATLAWCSFSGAAEEVEIIYTSINY